MPWSRDTDARSCSAGRRLELFASDFGPGAASLLCEQAGRRVVYAGLVGPDADVRAADALCLDARFGAPGTAFASRAAALAAIGRQVRDALGAGMAPRARVGARDRSPSRSPARWRPTASACARTAASCRRPPPTGPPGCRPPRCSASPGGSARARFCSGPRTPGCRRSGVAAAPCSRCVWRPVRPRPRLPTRPASTGTASSPMSPPTGAREVALLNAPGDELVRELASRGVDAYPLGPPRQLRLPAAR